ncbi:MAG: hypothetical protein CL920_17235 [Deltaproteobacteria bacterium]|nr:hypothetical protein [Deltaproteobacteria bacterium]|tara:strand:- start:15410 stop:17905 length:2496 start_codon:yes stop_codon:yes gene_type:complete
MAARTQSSRRSSKKSSNKSTESKEEVKKTSSTTNKAKESSKKKKPEEIGLRVIDGKDEQDERTIGEQAMEELRDNLRALTGEVNELIDLLPDDYSMPGINIDQIESGIQQAETFLGKPNFVVGFAGGFNAGKSMLINALLGQHVLKDGAVPTTSTVTRITATSDEECMYVHFFTEAQFEDLFARYMEDFSYLYQHTFNSDTFHGRDELTGLLDDIKMLRERLEAEDWNDRIRSLDSFYDLIVSYINHQNLLSTGPMKENLSRKNLIYYTTKAENSVAPLVREVQIAMSHPMLADGSELIDLPGLGSPDPRDEEITVEALRGNEETGKRECDAVVHVMDSLSPFRAGEDRLFQIYRKVWGESFSKRVFLVVSRWGKLEQQSPEEMLAVTKTVKRVAERYAVDGQKVFITDGRIGAQFEQLDEEERAERFKEEAEELEEIRKELEASNFPNGKNLFEITVNAMIDGNVPKLRDSLRYYLAFYKEYLHLSDAQRMLESQVNKIQQATSLHLPPLDQLEDDEERFIEECRSDIERQLKEMRNKARDQLQTFVQGIIQNEILPRDLSSLQEGLYQASSQRIEQQSPDHLRQQLFTAQLFTQGPMTNPVPWENFRHLLQQEVGHIDTEVEQFCGLIVEQILDQYRTFIFDDLGLQEILMRSFGDDPEGRRLSQKFQQRIEQLGHDLRLVARNINRLFFYEYSDVYHSRDHLDTLVDIREELESQFDQDVSSGDPRRATRWLLRQKMDYHFRKLSTFLPLCFLQQLQEVHEQLVELLEEAVYPIREAYGERLERREIGQEVDRIRHRYRQIRACLEHLQKVKHRMQENRQILNEHRPT